MENINEILDIQIQSILPDINSYKNDGYSFNINNKENILLITYNNILYETKIIKIDNDYYWHLSPYNNSYFITNLYNPNSFNMLLFAIKENDILYKDK